jgi:excisionase family DNA binding protein
MAERTPYLTPAEVAKILRVNVETVYRKVAADEIPHVRVGRRIRIPRNWAEPAPRATRAS